MSTLLMTSIQAGAGKTTLCAGIGAKILSQGRKVGFLKPIRILSEDSAEVVDRDAEFMKRVLGLEESAQSLCPVTLSRGEFDALFATESRAFLEDVKTAYSKLAQGKDLVLVEGLSGLGLDDGPAWACQEMAEALDAKVIIVFHYASDIPWPLLSALAQRFGSRFLGVVINGVPVARMASLQEVAVKVLGVLPEERLLLAVTVNELAQHFQGEVLNSPEQGDELVQNLMLGALLLDPGPLYFNLRDNKAVIARGDRADMQLAALETSTKCLVLTGGIGPIPIILHRAQEKKVPMILTKADTPATVAAVEELLAQARFHQEKKLETLSQILDQHLDLQALYSGLGLD